MTVDSRFVSGGTAASLRRLRSEIQKRRRRAFFARLTAPVFVLGPATFVAPSVAGATSFDDRTVEELARASDQVVTGRVVLVSVVPHGPAMQRGIHTRVVVAVTETLRGEHRDVVEVWVQGGQLGDRARLVVDQAQFRIGEEVLLFLFEDGNALWPTGMGRGKWTGPSDEMSPQVSLGEEPTPIPLAEVRRRVTEGAR